MGRPKINKELKRVELSITIPAITKAFVMRVSKQAFGSASRYIESLIEAERKK